MSGKFYTVDAQNPEVGGQLLPGVKLRVSRRTFAQVAAERFQALQAEAVAFAPAAAPSVDAVQTQVLYEAAARSKLVAP